MTLRLTVRSQQIAHRMVWGLFWCREVHHILLTGNPLYTLLELLLTQKVVLHKWKKRHLLACTWATEEFTDYKLGKNFTMETDHKPLASLLGNKHLDNLPPQILWFRLWLSWFSYVISHVPGKQLTAADILSKNLSVSTSLRLEANASTRDVGCVPRYFDFGCGYHDSPM